MNIFKYLEKSLHEIRDGEADFVPSTELLMLFLASHEALTGVKRELVDERDLALAIDHHRLQSMQSASTHHAEFLVMNKEGDYLHYFAVYAEFSSGKVKLLAMDYFGSHNCDLSHFKASPLASCPDVKLFVAGGDLLQNDTTSCAYFALVLLDTASKLPNLFRQCEKYADDEGEIDWKNLSPHLIKTAQSVYYILKYIDHLRLKKFRDLPLEADIPLLVEVLPGDDKCVADYLSKGIVTKEIKSHMKMVNSSILSIEAAKLAEQSLAFLSSFEGDQHKLLQLLYEKDYPLVYSLMSSLVERFKDEDEHPLVKKIFSDCLRFEEKLKYAPLSRLFHNPYIQRFMLDPKATRFVFNQCFINTFGFRNANIEKCELIALLGELLEEVDVDLFKELFDSRSFTAVLQHPELLAMIQNRQLSLDDALFIIPQKINPILWKDLDKDDARRSYLTSTSVSPNNPNNQQTTASALGASMSHVLTPDLSTFIDEEVDYVAPPNIGGSSSGYL